jgi:hypothetical protein
LDFSFESCTADLSRINDLQVFLLSDACPEKVDKLLLEEQYHLIETLNMKFLLLQDSFLESS